MPEGPEVRKHAAAIHQALAGKPIEVFTARTKGARLWLQEHPNILIGKRVEQVCSHGKHLIGILEDGFYFHSHLMMWGRWQVVPNTEPVPVDRRERARIATANAIAILFSAPVFEIGQGNPVEQVEYLGSLGPDILPYHGAFDTEAFLNRLLKPGNQQRTIGATLLDQQIVAGIGNYLRAEILFDCRLDPWKQVAGLEPAEIDCLCRSIPLMAQRAYSTSATVPDDLRTRMKGDDSLVYQPGREYGTRHYVFRRTNLPCLQCGDTVRQLRQVTREDEEGERTRIIYFCPTCQGTSVELKKPRAKPRRQISK